MKANIDLIMVCAGSQGQADKAHIPLGLLYVGSALKRDCYNVKIWHLLPDEFDAALPEIIRRNPLWVGLSVLSGMTTFHAAQLSKRIKQAMPNTPIVWGGHHASAVPDECLRESYIDYVIHGEGEDTAVEFSNALLGGGHFSEIRGLGYKSSDGKVIVNEGRVFVENLDRYELDWELLDIKAYMNRNTKGKLPVSFYSSRGCPYKCTFCATPLYTGSSYRYHSPEFVIRNLSYLKNKYGFNSVFFSDDNFMINQSRALEIIKGLAGEGISVDTVDVRLNQINEEVLAEFRKYNVSGIFFGYESGNDRILKLMNKGLDVAHIKQKVKLINKYGITVWASGIIGVPTETREEVYNTIDFSMWLRDNLPEGSTVSVYRYMPLPKTNLLQLALKEGFVYPEQSEEWKKIDPIEPYYSMSSWLKWITPDDERYLAFVQEFSRNRMLNYVNSHSPVVNFINNYFTKRLRAKVTSRQLNSDFELKCFIFARDLYSRIRYGKVANLKSNAIKA